MKTAFQILEEGKATIQDKSRWTQRAFARDKKGDKVSSNTPTAICWCSLGAINRIKCDGQYRQAHWYLKKAAGMDVADFNDTHTHEEVLAVFDKAIELAKAEEV